MPFSASSYFVGVATVLTTVALGFGGGVLMTDALVGHSDPRPSRVAERVAETTTLRSAVLSPERALAENPAAAEPVFVAPADSVQAQAMPVQQKPNYEAALAHSQKVDVKNAPAVERRKEARRLRAERRRQKVPEPIVAQKAQDAERDREPVMRSSYAAQSEPFSVFRLD